MKKLVFMICVLVCGCGGITEKGIQSAYRACDNYGGIDYIEPQFIGISDSSKVTCKEDMVFTVYTRSK